MKKKGHPNASERPLTTELLILPDGQVLVHNLTPAFADLLHELNPSDKQLAPRSKARRSPDRQFAASPHEL